MLQQFKLLPKQPLLEAKERQMKTKIVESSVGSTIVSLLPFAVREFHRLKFLTKVGGVALLFVGTNYMQMRPYFEEYIEECRKVVQKNIAQLVEDSVLPTD